MSDNYSFDPISEVSPSTRARRAGKPKKKLWPRILIWTLVGLIAAGVATAGVFIYQLNSSFNQAEKIAPQDTFPDETSRPEAVERPEDAKHDAQNILLLGSDIRGEISEDLALGGAPLAVQTVENII